MNLPGETFQSRLIDFRKGSISAGLSKLNYPALDVLRMDDDVKTQLRSKGKDPQLGQRRPCLRFRKNSWELGAHSPACGEMW